MAALLYQLAERPPPEPGDKLWPELPPPDELWPAIRSRLPDDEDDSRSLRRPLIIACLVGVLIGVLLSLSLLLDLRPGH
ncbi:hypothetical protein [Pseudomonas sp. 30_B]|uniref:hypothetical protein n=1 Tax=Pseudomonas sp. 30_B TaxID=2813575 RepID=UPI001A9CE1E9|nr:hypothetical protein [Pseudomonas sp. 30_B]